jgi:hypothetical protein
MVSCQKELFRGGNSDETFAVKTSIISICGKYGRFRTAKVPTPGGGFASHLISGGQGGGMGSAVPRAVSVRVTGLI